MLGAEKHKQQQQQQHNKCVRGQQIRPTFRLHRVFREVACVPWIGPGDMHGRKIDLVRGCGMVIRIGDALEMLLFLIQAVHRHR